MNKRNPGFQSLETDLRALRDLAVAQTADLGTVKNLIDKVINKEAGAKSKAFSKVSSQKFLVEWSRLSYFCFAVYESEARCCSLSLDSASQDEKAGA